MTQERWTAVDKYYADMLVPADPALDAALEASAKAGLPDIQVTPNQGKLLMLLAQIQGAKNILEIGTLGGYSTIWLGRALPVGGRLITLEAEAKHADVARANIAGAGLAGVVEIRLGKALDSLPKIADEGRGPFDFIFIDADKENTAQYFTWSLRLSRPGAIIIVDNVDEIHLAVSPVVLGRGENLLAGIDLAKVGFKVIEHTPTARATHILLSKS